VQAPACLTNRDVLTYLLSYRHRKTNFRRILMINIPLATLQSFTLAYTESDIFGKLIILSLLLVSVICWVILSFKVWQARKVRDVSLRFQAVVNKNKEHLLSLEIESLPKVSHTRIPHPYASIFSVLKAKTLETLNKKIFFIERSEGPQDHPIYLSKTDLELLESELYTTISMQSKLLEKDLFILSTSVTLAPFLGLLGTVWGILVTFAELQGGASVGSNSIIIGGLSTALSTTVLGLVIAIPALIAYNYLKNNLKVVTSDMEDFVHSLLSTIEMQYRKVDIS
jgi:biopolymer transport protein TolQ